MKENTFKNSIISTVLVCIWLLLTSQAVLAGKPVSTPDVADVVIHSVVVDFYNSQIVVAGTGLSGVSEGFLSVVDIINDITIISDNNLEIAFSSASATAVPGAGNYSLALNGNAFSVYFSSAIVFFPNTSGCPCQSIWESYGATEPPDGFAGLMPYCIIDNVDQVGVQFLNFEFSQMWILTTEYNGTATECALVYDAPTQNLDSIDEHNACSLYLRDNYITPNPLVDSCF